VEDAQLLLEVIAGNDPNDATCSTNTVPEYHKAEADSHFKIGYIRECIEHEGIGEDVKEVTLATIEKLKSKGHVVEEISFDLLDYLVPVYYVLTTAEASSNFSRYSGLLYGYRSNQATDLETTFRRSRTEGFGPEVKRRIMLGTFVLSAGYYDAYYSKGQQVRQLVKKKTQELFKSYDFILSPTTPTTAFKIGEKASNPIAMYLADVFTVHANIAGNPAISIPVGTNSEGLPIGVQLMGKDFDESGLLAFSKQL
jgi:aspartyl-tRNA(Asn)/glutamyl-tRNA(Gln) amidotransferase subunit A